MNLSDAQGAPSRVLRQSRRPKVLCEQISQSRSTWFADGAVNKHINASSDACTLRLLRDQEPSVANEASVPH